MRFHCRCRHCGTRRVLPRKPEHYEMVPQCRVCGLRYLYRVSGKRKLQTDAAQNGIREPVFRVDKWMQQRTAKNRAMGCMCGGYDWAGMMTGAMHRIGSKRCWYRADGSKREFGDPDYFMDPRFQVEYDESN